jgi:hypothetical protein
MRKLVFATILFFSVKTSHAQIAVMKLVGSNAKQYGLGFGGFIKFSYPVTDAADLTFEGGANFFSQKEDHEYGIAVVPVKLGYRYTLNGTGTGFYVEPQAGYNVYGVTSYYNYETYQNTDKKFHGVIGALAAGYLFQPSGLMQFDLGLQYESIFHSGGSTNYIGLRLTHNFSFSKREE